MLRKFEGEGKCGGSEQQAKALSLDVETEANLNGLGLGERVVHSPPHLVAGLPSLPWRQYHWMVTIFWEHFTIDTIGTG